MKIQDHARVSKDIHRIEKLVLDALSDMNTKKKIATKPIDKLIKALQQIGVVKAYLEDVMFHDNPELSNDYLFMYYGEPKDATRLAKEYKGD